MQGLFGNATEINAKEVQKDLEATLVEGETVVKSFSACSWWFRSSPVQRRPVNSIPGQAGFLPRQRGEGKED